MTSFPQSGILVEARSFNHYGGWILDSQFELENGIVYLLAHGNGTPVSDATTTINVPEDGKYNVHVRAKDWIPGHHPGRFTLKINQKTVDVEFGANDKDWSWQQAGSIELPKGESRLALHDLTGFCGRCDAIFFSRENTPPPEGMDKAARAWRKKIRGVPDKPVDMGNFDAIVVGGGVPGVAAALLLARLGDRVALIHNRPFLGGNASIEAGLRPRGITGPLIDEITQRHPSGDLFGRQLLEKEKNVTLLMEHTVYDAITKDSTIKSIDARDAHTGREFRLSAPIFIDCSGRVILGLLSGAETLYGQESKAEYGENLAAEQRDEMHHGNTLFFRTRIAESSRPFPKVPWATEVAKDFANLGGQLKRPGLDNGEGPAVPPPAEPGQASARRMNWPLTHFWEYGQFLDPYTNGEHIRDHLLRAIYGTFSNVKTLDPKSYENLEFDWVSFAPATGEFKRYKGDHVLNETEIRDHKHFPDAVVQNDSAFCLHYPGDKYSFRLEHWEWDERDGKPYDIPFRCLYSTNISNLMMAGKHISVTHVAGSNTKFIGNGGQHAIATAAAAHLCKKYNTKPKSIREKHMAELQDLAGSITRKNVRKRQSRL